MASSVSSERAFSQGGITISKRRNRLKGDIVEALQCVKCAIRHDLLFRESAPSSAVEEEFEESDNELEDDDNDVEVVSVGIASGDKDEELGWDEILLDDDDDNFEEIEGDIFMDSDDEFR